MNAAPIVSYLRLKIFLFNLSGHKANVADCLCNSVILLLHIVNELLQGIGMFLVIINPRNIEIELVTHLYFVQSESAPPSQGVAHSIVGFAARLYILGIIAGYKIVEMLALQRTATQRMLDTRPVIVEPGLGGGAFPIEEQYIGLYARGIKDTHRQAQNRVQIEMVKQLATKLHAGTAFKENVVGHHHSRTAAR